MGDGIHNRYAMIIDCHEGAKSEANIEQILDLLNQDGNYKTYLASSQKPTQAVDCYVPNDSQSVSDLIGQLAGKADDDDIVLLYFTGKNRSVATQDGEQKTQIHMQDGWHDLSDIKSKFRSVAYVRLKIYEDLDKIRSGYILTMPRVIGCTESSSFGASSGSWFQGASMLSLDDQTPTFSDFFSACSEQTLQKNAQALVEQLGSPDVEKRKSALTELATLLDVAELALPQITKCLSDPDAEVRAKAIDCFSYLGSAAASEIPDLINCITDKNNDVVKSLGNTLRALENTAQAAVPLLQNYLDSSDVQLRARAAWLLGETGVLAAPAQNQLTQLLKDDNQLNESWGEGLYEPAGQNFAICEIAAKSLGNIGNPVPLADDLFMKNTDLSDSAAKIRSCHLLALMGPAATQAVSFLNVLSQDTNINVRRAAFEAINAVSPYSESAFALLKAALSELDPIIREDVLYFLADDSRSNLNLVLKALPEITHCLDDHEILVRKAAIACFVNLFGKACDEPNHDTEELQTLMRAAPEIDKILTQHENDPDTEITDYILGAQTNLHDFEDIMNSGKINKKSRSTKKSQH